MDYYLADDRKTAMGYPNESSDLNLGARTLGTLAAVPDTYAFSNWFETQFGPEDAPLEGPL